jgi:DNA-binding NarL/FixJ family response regulator
MRELVGATEAALDAADELSPRLVIMDKRLPGMGGIEATRVLTARHPRIVVLLVSVEDPHPQLIRSCGAAAFARKQALSPQAAARLMANSRDLNDRQQPESVGRVRMSVPDH